MTGPQLPTPDELRTHHQFLKPATALANGVAISSKIPIAGASKGRLYFKASVAATIAYYFLRTDGATRYDTLAHAQDAPVANTEQQTELVFDGESWLEVVVTPGAAGVLTYADLALIKGP